MNFMRDSGIIVWVFSYLSSSTRSATGWGPAGSIYEIVSSPTFSHLNIWNLVGNIGVVTLTRSSGDWVKRVVISD